MTYWIIGPQLIGLLFLVLGWLQKTFPPKKLNSLYGYRMPSAQTDQLRWDEAQQYSGLIMMKLGIIYLVTGLVIAAGLYQFHYLNRYSAAILTIFAGISAAVLRIVYTERHLTTVFKE